MKKNIAEDLPARKFPQASLSKSNVGGDDNRSDNRSDNRESQGSKTPEKRVSQAVYDIRYRARRENLPLRQAYASYTQNSSLSEQEKSMVREKLFGKDGIVKENYIGDISSLASNSVAKALYDVFSEKKCEEIGEEYIEELKKDFFKKEISRIGRESGERKYKIRVTDNSGVSYVRYANREKINSLRANPNIREVEMTEYGEPYEGEKNKGEQTATAKSGKDYDGDGNVESGAKEFRGSVHNAIQRKKGGNPDGQDTSNVKEQFAEKLDVKSKKKPKNKIVVYTNDDNKNMNESSYSKFLRLLNDQGMEPNEDKLKEESSCESDDRSNNDPRSMPTKVNLIKNRLRAAGAKNPIIMVSDEEDVKEGAGLSVGISRAVGGLLANPRTSAEQGAKNIQMNVTDPIGKAVKGVVRSVVQPANMSPEAQKARKNKYIPN